MVQELPQEETGEVRPRQSTVVASCVNREGSSAVVLHNSPLGATNLALEM